MKSCFVTGRELAGVCGPLTVCASAPLGDCPHLSQHALAGFSSGTSPNIPATVLFAVETGVGAVLFRQECSQVGLEAFTAVTMKNVVFWGIKIQFVLHRRHITSPLQRPAS
jgi:hypothetical protein